MRIVFGGRRAQDCLRNCEHNVEYMSDGGWAENTVCVISVYVKLYDVLKIKKEIYTMLI